MDADTVRGSLLEKLQQLNEVRDLQEICNGLNVNIPPAKQGKLLAVCSLLLRHLTSEYLEQLDDEGLSVFQDVLLQVNGKLGNNQTATTPTTTSTATPVATPAVTSTGIVVKTEAGATSTSTTSQVTPGSATSTTSTTDRNMVMVEHIRVNKEFKLGGVVGDGKNCLGYGTIYYRMLEGKTNGYKPKEIMAGVVRAMQSGSELGAWFETHPDLEWDEFLEILRNHYQLENYGRMLMNLGKEFQKPNEEAIDFAYRMTRLRDDILAVAAHEKAVVERKMVQEQCLHGLSVGLRSNTIRMELRQVLSDQTIKDPVLFKEVTAAAKREKEYLLVQQEQQEAQSNACTAKKKHGSGNATTAAATTTEDKTSRAILAELQKLTASNEQLAAQMNARVSEMSVLKNDFEEFKKRFADNGGGGAANGGPFRPRVLKCPVCEVSGAYCKHCAHCGEDGHKIRNCPTKKN